MYKHPHNRRLVNKERISIIGHALVNLHYRSPICLCMRATVKMLMLLT